MMSSLQRSPTTSRARAIEQTCESYVLPSMCRSYHGTCVMQSGHLVSDCMVQVRRTSRSPLAASVSEPSYTATFTVDRRPDEAFNAINNVRDWWEDTIAGPTHEVG